jgi:hypothetical protein
MNILKKIFTTCEHAKLISNMSFDLAIKIDAIPDKDL